MATAETDWINPAHQARSRVKRDRLLHAARELIEERGFEASRITDIAARAGCSVGTFYNRFRDKAALFHALQDAFRRGTETRADTLLDPARWTGRPLADAADTLVADMVAMARARRGFIRAALGRRMAEPETWTAMRDGAAYMTRRFAELCERRPAEVGHPRPRVAAGFAVQMIVGTLINAILNEPEPLHLDDARLERELSAMMRGYLGLSENSSSTRP